MPLLLLLFLTTLLPAQDLRSVAEPAFPAPCTQLQAQLTNPPTSEAQLDTARIQAALNACPPGQAVQLQAALPNTAFLSGPLQLPKGVTLLLDPAVTLLASRNPRDYDSSSAQTCGTLATTSTGCVPFITANRADGAGIMGYGTIDGRGHLPMLPGGLPSSQTWWDLARSAAGSLSQNNPRLLQISNTDRFTLYKIIIRNSPNFHVAIGTSTNLTVWGVKIITPYDARNSDGIDPGYSSNVTITRSFISVGDDNVAVGGSNPPGASHISVVNNWFGDGHGASIGSFTQNGVSDILFDRITIAGDTANSNAIGMRIKSDISRGGLVQHVTYSNICLRAVRATIVLDPFYTAGATGALIPHFDDIVFRNVHATTEGTVKIQGHDAAVPTAVTLDNVQIDNLKQSDLTQSYVNYTLGPDPANLAPFLRGTGVTITNNVATANAPYVCPAAAFSPIAGEIIPTADPSTLAVQLFTTKAITYAAYLTRLKTDPNATLDLTPPTGGITLSEGDTPLVTAKLTGTRLTFIPIPAGSHILTATYSGDANYPPFTIGTWSTANAPAIATAGIVNAASYAGGGIAPRTIFTIFGKDFGPDPKVEIKEGTNQYQAKVIYATDNQINAILPEDIPTGSAELTVDQSKPSTLYIPKTNLGLFPVAQNYNGPEDQPVNTPQTPAKPGQILILWGTGLGNDKTANVTVANQPAEVLYAGKQSEFEGVDNIYLRIPENTPGGCQIEVKVNEVKTKIAVTACAN